MVVGLFVLGWCRIAENYQLHCLIMATVLASGFQYTEHGSSNLTKFLKFYAFIICIKNQWDYSCCLGRLCAHAC